MAKIDWQVTKSDWGEQRESLCTLFFIVVLFQPFWFHWGAFWRFLFGVPLPLLIVLLVGQVIFLRCVSITKWWGRGNLCALYCIVLFQPLWSSWFGQNFWKTGRVLSLGDAESCYKFISSKKFETLWQAGSKVDQKRAKKGILKNCQTSPGGVHA